MHVGEFREPVRHHVAADGDPDSAQPSPLAAFTIAAASSSPEAVPSPQGRVYPVRGQWGQGVAPPGQDPPSPLGAVVEGRVALVELLDVETNIHVVLADAQVPTTRAPAEAAPRHGDKLRVALRMGRAHLLDLATEEAVS